MRTLEGDNMFRPHYEYDFTGEYQIPQEKRRNQTYDWSEAADSRICPYSGKVVHWNSNVGYLLKITQNKKELRAFSFPNFPSLSRFLAKRGILMNNRDLERLEDNGIIELPYTHHWAADCGFMHVPHDIPIVLPVGHSKI